DWAADRRDFVAVERERLAVERERVADERDANADLRDRVADAREREALDREASLESSQVSGLSGSDVLGATDRDDARRHNRRRREDAAAARRDAAERRSFAADDWGPLEFGPRLTAMFADVALQLFGGEDLDEALPHLLALSVAAVPGCDRAAITVVEGGRPLHTVASDDVARELELEQWSGATGPAPAVLADGEDVSVRALDDAARWPRLAAAATRLGVGAAASHCLMLRASDGWIPVGTLTFYGAGTDAFDEDDLGALSLVGSYAAVAIALADQRADLDRREAALHRALSTRDVIGQAKGILMERRHLSAGDAFDVLRRTSQRLNRRLADVAEQLSRTGELP
ncbi:MAG TPA: GAF and ANTAR domain-containing protein, partial [Candidatus Nanopelagicales bacterium]|nr:GAF and ANTAR domain-containing protein [Candidatus Nanopelagicales bacterium]